jgi:hypothetical protein
MYRGRVCADLTSHPGRHKIVPWKHCIISVEIKRALIARNISVAESEIFNVERHCNNTVCAPNWESLLMPAFHIPARASRPARIHNVRRWVPDDYAEQCLLTSLQVTLRREAFQPTTIRPKSTNPMQLRPSREVASCAATQKFHNIPKAHYRVHKSPDWSISWARSVQPISPQPISLKSISYPPNLCFTLPSTLFPPGFPTKIIPLLPHSCYMPCKKG